MEINDNKINFGEENEYSLNAVVKEKFSDSFTKIADYLGDLRTLTTPIKTSIVNSINSIPKVNDAISLAKYQVNLPDSTGVEVGDILQISTLDSGNISGFSWVKPAVATQFIKSVDTNRYDTTAGKLTDKVFTTVGDGSSFDGLKVDIANIKKIEIFNDTFSMFKISVPDDNTTGLEISAPKGGFDIANKAYVDSKAGKTYTGTNPIVINDTVITFNFNSTQFKIGDDGLEALDLSNATVTWTDPNRS